jgi:integrase/recombinase XerC/integrase/recombinase XerD
MSIVTPLRRVAGPMTLAEATRRFLRRDAFEESTRVSYGRTLGALAEVVGADTDGATVTTEQL